MLGAVAFSETAKFQVCRKSSSRLEKKQRETRYGKRMQGKNGESAIQFALHFHFQVQDVTISVSLETGVKLAECTRAGSISQRIFLIYFILFRDVGSISNLGAGNDASRALFP